MKFIAASHPFYFFVLSHSELFYNVRKQLLVVSLNHLTRSLILSPLTRQLSCEPITFALLFHHGRFFTGSFFCECVFCFTEGNRETEKKERKMKEIFQEMQEHR